MPTPTDIGFRIKPVFMGQAATAEGKRFGGMLRGFDTSMKAAQLSGERMMRSMQSGMMALGRAAQVMGAGMRNAFMGGMGGLQRFSTGIDNLLHKVVNLRNVLIGGVITGGTYKVVRHVLHAGAEDLQVQRRIRRQFGENAPMLQALAGSMGKRLGLDDSDALRGLIPMMEAVDATARIGSRYGRGKIIRNKKQLAEARADAMSNMSGIFYRAKALNPELDPELLGRAIAEAGTGEEARKRLVSMLGINKAIANDFFDANKHGRLAKLLTKEQADKLGIKPGHKVGLGTVLTALVETHGLSQKAADEEMATPMGQMRQISGMLHRAVSDIGVRAWEKINAAMAKTGNFAERLQKYLDSEKGKKFVDTLANGFAKVVEWVTKLAAKIPDLVTKLSEHKDLLKWLAILGGGAYATGKVWGKAQGIFGVGKDIASTLGLGQNAMPVKVVNWPGSLVPGSGGGVTSGGEDPLLGGGGAGSTGKAAGTLSLIKGNVGKLSGSFGVGYGVGTLLDQTIGVSDSVAGTGVYSTVAADANRLENTESGKALREIAQAKTLANKVARGHLSPDDALRTFTGLARTIEGNKTGPLSGFSEVVARQIARGDTSLLKNFEASPEMLQRKLAETGGIKINVNISTPFLKDPVEFVDSLYPIFKDQVVRDMRVANASGR